MTEIVFKTIWQSDELSRLQNPSQEQIRCKGDMSGVNLEHARREKKWLFAKKKKSVSFHGTERNKTIDDAQLSCPELRRSVASTNVSTLNLSCDKESTDSAESLDSRKCQSPVTGTDDVKVPWSSRQLSVSPCAIFLDRVEKNKNATNSLREYTRKLEGKHKKLENLLNKLESDRRGMLDNSLFLEKSNKQNHTFEMENNALQQRSSAVEKNKKLKHTFEMENSALQQRSLAFEKSNKQKHTFQMENNALQQRSSAVEKSNKQNHTFEIENNALQQRSSAVEKNLCQKMMKDDTQWRDNVRKESEDGLAATLEKKASSVGNPQLQILEQIARSMSDLRHVLTSQLNEIKEKSNLPSTSSNLIDKEPNISPIMLENVRESLGNVVDKFQSKTAHQRDKLKMLNQFDGNFEAFNQQWERTQREHQRTTQMIQELRTEIDSIANTSKRMVSAFDQIQENIHNLGHIKPLIENIQKLLERRKKQQRIEERYMSSISQRSMQGEVLQRMVDQAVLPLVERIRMCHYPFTCNECSGNCKHKMITP